MTDMKALVLRVRSSARATLLLQLLSHFISLLCVAAFGLVCYFAVSDSAAALVRSLVILGVPLVLVSLLRRAINAPRPCELYGFSEDAPNEKRGSSFPSRHAHSAFAIATLLALFSLPLGLTLGALAIALCIARVLIGKHFIRDVAAGALTGVFSSLIGILILL